MSATESSPAVRPPGLGMGASTRQTFDTYPPRTLEDIVGAEGAAELATAFQELLVVRDPQPGQRVLRIIPEAMAVFTESDEQPPPENI